MNIKRLCCFGFAVVLAGIAFISIVTNTIIDRWGRKIRRRDNPREYWVIVAGELVGAIALLTAGILPLWG
jgi:hypothetical protein